MDTQRATDTITAEPPRRLRLDELLRELGALLGIALDRPLQSPRNT